MEDKIIKIDPAVEESCKVMLSLDNLNEFQEEIKTLLPENAEKLKKSIKDHGFNMPFFLWKDPEDDSLNLLDGHQRKKVLQELQEENYQLPEFFPCIFVSAETKEEAKKKILSFVSQAGQIDQQKLFDFMVNNEITIEDIKTDFTIPELPILSFESTYFNNLTDQPQEEIEDLGQVPNVEIEGEKPNKNIDYVIINFDSPEEYVEFSVNAEFKGRTISYKKLKEQIEKGKWEHES